MGIQPRILNILLHRLSRSKNKADATVADAIELTKYPLAPFVGEMGFVILRGIGFILTFLALQTVTWQQIPQLFSAFSFAWLLGLIVPGAPGGLGIFEVTAYGLLDNTQFPTEITAVAFYRLISILAEAIAALVCFRGKTSSN
jgi:glycosyltransferase 2 family protein